MRRIGVLAAGLADGAFRGAGPGAGFFPGQAGHHDHRQRAGRRHRYLRPRDRAISSPIICRANRRSIVQQYARRRRHHRDELLRQAGARPDGTDASPWARPRRPIPLLYRKPQSQFDPTKFHFIGGVGRGGTMLMIRKDAEPRLYDKSKPPVIMGSLGGVPRSGMQTTAWGIAYPRLEREMGGRLSRHQRPASRARARRDRHDRDRQPVPHPQVAGRPASSRY